MATKIDTSRIATWEANRKTHRLVCCYCSGNIGSGKLDIDGDAAHAKCHREACK